MAGGAAAAAEAVPPVLAHVTARLDVLLGWERVGHLQLPAVPHPAGNSSGQGDPEASSPRWLPSVPSRTPWLCPQLLPSSPCIYPCCITLQLAFSQILLFTCSHHPVLLPAGSCPCSQCCSLLPAPVPGWRSHSQVSWQVAFSHTSSGHDNQPHNSPRCLRPYLPALWPPREFTWWFYPLRSG